MDLYTQKEIKWIYIRTLCVYFPVWVKFSMRYTVLLSLLEYAENQRTESRTSLIGLDEISSTSVP
jgi:hypothetical protein